MEIVPARLKEKQCHPFCVIHVYTGSGTGKLFTVFSISKTCVVSVFLGDGAMIYLFCAAITDIGRLIQSFALFLHKILASLITGGAGSAFYIAENDFSADIGFPAMEAMNTKVMGIIESTFVIPVG